MPDIPDKQTPTSISALLFSIGGLLQDCHRESLALQEEISATLPSEDIDLAQLRTYQHLDHITQVHDDLSRLIPALAGVVGNGGETADELAAVLRLVSLRDRLFGESEVRPGDSKGEVTFF